MSPISVSNRYKSLLTVLICVGLVILAGLIFATSAAGAARFITTPIGYAPPDPDPVRTWKLARVDMKVVRAIQNPPRPALRAPTRLPDATGDVWSRLRNCESSDGRSSPSGRYHGYFQFSQATWNSMGGKGNPGAASYEEQLMRAKKLQAQSGWGQWPACSRKLGLR